ncbi:MAG: hypothetical protein L0221_18725 [Chloroflexi bacterium]|nr:hypothetical protein [Chloroflexota bacterium]
MEITDHTTGVVYDRQGALGSWRALLKAEHPTVVEEPLATLGDSLALCRESISASGFAGVTFDVGPYKKQEVDLVEVDALGRRRRTEIFAADRLGDAVARLYERYADLLPDGPERVRATATARSVAALLGPVDVERFAPALGPAVEVVDHRHVGLPPSRGREAYLRSTRSLLEVAADVASRLDDVICLRSDAILVRATNFGTERIGGGAFERPLLVLAIFDADGLLTRFEFFDVDRDGEALARFDELTAEPAALLPSR